LWGEKENKDESDQQQWGVRYCCKPTNGVIIHSKIFKCCTVEKKMNAFQHSMDLFAYTIIFKNGMSLLASL